MAYTWDLKSHEVILVPVQVRSAAPEKEITHDTRSQSALVKNPGVVGANYPTRYFFSYYVPNLILDGGHSSGMYDNMIIVKNPENSNSHNYWKGCSSHLRVLSKIKYIE